MPFFILTSCLVQESEIKIKLSDSKAREGEGGFGDNDHHYGRKEIYFGDSKVVWESLRTTIVGTLAVPEKESL